MAVPLLVVKLFLPERRLGPPTGFFGPFMQLLYSLSRLQDYAGIIPNALVKDASRVLGYTFY